MTSKSDVLVNTYGTDSPKAARFGEGARTREEIQDATDKRRALSDASKPRRYSER